MKQHLTFYTNIPTPYNLDFFAALSNRFHLNVVYYASIEENRQWKLDWTNVPYQVKVLEGGLISRLLQKLDYSSHFSFGIFKTILQDKADIVIVSGSYHAPNSIIAIIGTAIKGRKVAFLSEKIPAPSGRSKKNFKKLLLLPIKIFADYLIAVGPEVSKSYEVYGIKKRSINVPYNIDHKAFYTDVLDKRLLDQFNKKYKSHNELVLISSGALIERKGMAILIDAIKLLPKGTNVRLLILGDGTLYQALKEKVGLDERINLLGFQEKEAIPYYFNISDIFVFASWYDGWGLVINEAMSAGLPVLAHYKVGAATALVKDYENGFLIKSNKAEEFAERVLELYNNEPLRKKMAENNKAVAKDISSEALAIKLESFFAK